MSDIDTIVKQFQHLNDLIYEVTGDGIKQIVLTENSYQALKMRAEKDIPYFETTIESYETASLQGVKIIRVNKGNS